MGGESEAHGNDGSKHEADLLAFHHPVVGGVALPTSAVVRAEREFEGALTWLGEPARPFDPLRVESQSWEVRFDLPEGSRAARRAACGCACVRAPGLPRTAGDMTRLTFPEASLPDGLPSGSRSIAVRSGGRGAPLNRAERPAVDGQWSIGRSALGSTPRRCKRGTLDDDSHATSAAVLRDKETPSSFESSPKVLARPPPLQTTTVASEARGPIQVKSALIEWTN